jgi:hypothetical protein
VYSWFSQEVAPVSLSHFLLPMGVACWIIVFLIDHMRACKVSAVVVRETFFESKNIKCRVSAISFLVKWRLNEPGVPSGEEEELWFLNQLLKIFGFPSTRMCVLMAATLVRASERRII